MTQKLTFHINNMAYTINVDESLKSELTRYLQTDKNLETRELLAAYIRVSQEHSKFKQEIEQISNKIPSF
ncbi:hypothetical protein [Malaciobacter marinus]|uniref:Uncharacterized protein n=1 Tax=Malaciobacter marinus TaxID=505249 RepID=A0AB37A057_9BACT|nr:hypothetical protein [Malaciobacter marinus]PPK62148.1 hypothetical protein B0F89_10581 [Malaciobacter marinus]